MGMEKLIDERQSILDTIRTCEMIQKSIPDGDREYLPLKHYANECLIMLEKLLKELNKKLSIAPLQMEKTKITMSVSFPKNYNDPTVVTLKNQGKVGVILCADSGQSNVVLKALKIICALTGYEHKSI